MPSRRVTATQSHAARAITRVQSTQIRKRKKEARSWILLQRGDSSRRLKSKKWATFRIPFEKLELIYNLRPEVYLHLKDEYLSGRTDESSEIVARPKHKSHIRQDILALALTQGKGLSLADFVTAKKLATARNTGRSSGFGLEEHAKWPARPDIFLNCPDVDPDALSEDEIADYYASEKYKSDGISDEESSDSEDESFCAHISESGNVTTSRPKSSIDGSTVAAPQDLCLRYGSWAEYKRDMAKYGVCKTTLYRLREAVRKLHDGNIEGVSWEDFEESFDVEDLMSMKLKSDKVESSKQVVSTLQAYKRYYPRASSNLPTECPIQAEGSDTS